MSHTPLKTERTDASPNELKIIDLVLDYYDRYKRRRWVFERDWYRNILFYIGQQWVIYEEGSRRWRVRNIPHWIPTPVTNRLAATVNVIRSSVAQVTPAFEAVPTQEDERSVLTANAADKYLDIIMGESGFRGARRRMASWITLTGNGFLLTEFDTSPDTGMAFVPGEQCVDCGNQMKPQDIPEDMTCPKCGSKNLEESKDAGVSIPQGRLRVLSKSPFEVYVDNNIQELDDQTAVLVVEQHSLDEVKRTYGDAAKDVSADNLSDQSINYLSSLAYMTGSGGSGAITRGGEDSAQLVTLFRLYLKTTADFPDGMYVVMSGDQHILENKAPYPFRFKTTQRPFFPLTHVRYDDVPGRFWAKTPVDDLIPKQRQRNEVESLYQTILMRCANPVWLIPTSSNPSPITGDPGLALKYTPVGGLKPERLQGVDAPNSVVAFIQMIDQDFEEIANTFAVMKGKQPGSVRAASAIQMLVERGFGRYGSVFDNMEEAYQQWGVVALELWRQKAVFPRVQAIAKEAGAWQFMEFLGADIGDVDIRVEAGSTRPKSAAGRQMLLNQLFQWGLLNGQDPEQKLRIFEEMGATSFLSGAEGDVKVVAEENQKFLKWAQDTMKQIDSAGGDLPPAELLLPMIMQSSPLKGNPVIDHHPTHAVHHRRFALGEAFRALPDVLQQIFVQHLVTAHLPYLLQEAQTGLGMTGLMAGMLPPPPGQAGQSAGKGSPAQGGGPGGSVGPFGSSKGGQE